MQATAENQASAVARGNVAVDLLGAGADSAPALVTEGRQVSYEDLRAAVARLGGQLSARLAPGSRVGLLAENGAFFVVGYLAAIRAGLCVVPLPTAVQREWLESVLARTDTSVVLTSRRLAGDEDLAALSSPLELWVESADDPLSIESPPRVDSDQAPAGGDRPADLAALFFTSGSTGDPKGVMVTQANIAANTRDIVEYLGLTAADRAMLVLPLHYCYGLSVLHSHLAAGASVVLSNSFMFPEKVLDAMRESGCTGFAGVPSHYQILLRKTRFKEREFPALRWLQQAGGKLPDVFIHELRASFPEVELFIMYGQTEATARLSYLPPGRLGDKLGSIGRGLPSTILQVLDESGTPVTPGSDTVGEIVATGDNIALGYWNDPEATDRYFRGRHLRTRDLARVDADGFIFIVDRARDFIKAMGTRISPKEIEDVIVAMPEVVEAAVIGVPDETWGEAVKAIVVPVRPGAFTPADVVSYCNARLPNAKVPTRVELADRLPKSESGKVLKEELRRQHAAASHDGV